MYRLSHQVVDWVWLITILGVPLSALLFDTYGFVPLQDGGISESNQAHEQMGQPCALTQVQSQESRRYWKFEMIEILHLACHNLVTKR